MILVSWLCALVLGVGCFYLRLPPDTLNGSFIVHIVSFFSLAGFLAISFVELGFRLRSLFIKASEARVDLALGFGAFAYFLCFYLKFSLNPVLPLTIASGFFISGLVRSFRHRGSLAKLLVRPESPWIVLGLLAALAQLSFFYPGFGLLYLPVDGDSGLFHVTFPAQVIHAGHYFNPDWLRVPWHPQLTHGWYIFILSFANDLFLKSLNVLAFLQFAILFIWVSSPFGRVLGLLSFVLLSLVPEFRANLSTTSLDTGLAFFTVSAFGVLYDFLKKPEWRNLLLIAILMGFAGGQKHFGLMFSAPLLGLAGLFYLYSIKRERFFGGVKELAICAAVFIFTWIPFYAHNWLEGTSLLFPFFGSHVNPWGWTEPEIVSFLGDVIQHWGFKHSLFGFFQIPFHLIYHSDYFQFALTHTIGDWAFSFELLALFALLVGSLLFKKLREPSIWISALLLVLQAFLWYRGSQVVRYLYPLLISSAYFFSRFLVSAGARTNAVVQRYGSACFLMGAVFLVQPFQHLATWPLPLSETGRQEWYEKYVTDNASAFYWLKDHNRPNTRILSFATSAINYNFPELILCGDFFAKFRYLNYLNGYHTFKEWNEVAVDFKKHQFAYIIVQWGYFPGFDRPKDGKSWDLFFPSSVLKCVSHAFYDGHHTDIFEVNPAA